MVAVANQKLICQVWLHFSKLSAENAFFNIFIAECKAGYGNASNLKKTLVKPKIQLKAECTGFEAKFIDTHANFSLPVL